MIKKFYFLLMSFLFSAHSHAFSREDYQDDLTVCLPFEIKSHIVSYVEIGDLMTMSAVSKDWHEVVERFQVSCQNLDLSHYDRKKSKINWQKALNFFPNLKTLNISHNNLSDEDINWIHLKCWNTLEQVIAHHNYFDQQTIRAFLNRGKPFVNIDLNLNYIEHRSAYDLIEKYTDQGVLNLRFNKRIKSSG